MKTISRSFITENPTWKVSSRQVLMLGNNYGSHNFEIIEVACEVVPYHDFTLYLKVL